MTADGASSSLRVDPLDCDPRIVELIDAFCHAMRVERNASVHTLRAYRIDLMDFARWACRERIDILAATHRQLRRYLGELDRAQYSRTTVNRRLSALRSFFRWLNVTGIADEDPASILQGPKRPGASANSRPWMRGTSLCWNSCTHAAPACPRRPVCLRPTWISEAGR